MKKSKSTKQAFDFSSADAASSFKKITEKFIRVEPLTIRLVKQAHQYILDASDNGLSSDDIAMALTELSSENVSGATVRKALQQIKLNAGRKVEKKNEQKKVEQQPNSVATTVTNVPKVAPTAAPVTPTNFVKAKTDTNSTPVFMPPKVQN